MTRVVCAGQRLQSICEASRPAISSAHEKLICTLTQKLTLAQIKSGYSRQTNGAAFRVRRGKSSVSFEFKVLVTSRSHTEIYVNFCYVCCVMLTLPYSQKHPRRQLYPRLQAQRAQNVPLPTNLDTKVVVPAEVHGSTNAVILETQTSITRGSRASRPVQVSCWERECA